MRTLILERQNILLILLFMISITIGGHRLALGQGEQNRENDRLTNRQQSGSEPGKLPKQQADAIQFEMDSQDPIFVYDVRGEFRVAPPAGIKPDPRLRIYADGKIVVASPRAPQMESKFSEQELNEFLDFVVNKNRFYEMDSLDLAGRMAGKGDVQIADGAASVFSVNLLKGKKEVSVYTLWNAIRNFPDFDELKRLTVIEKRCARIVSQVHLGDEGEAVLALVNQQVKAKAKELEIEIQPLTLNQIRLAARGAHGRFQVSFEQVLPGSDPTNPQKLHVIYFQKSGDDKPEVQFYGLPVKN